MKSVLNVYKSLGRVWQIGIDFGPYFSNGMCMSRWTNESIGMLSYSFLRSSKMGKSFSDSLFTSALNENDFEDDDEHSV